VAGLLGCGNPFPDGTWRFAFSPADPAIPCGLPTRVGTFTPDTILDCESETDGESCCPSQWEETEGGLALSSFCVSWPTPDNVDTDVELTEVDHDHWRGTLFSARSPTPEHMDCNILATRE
jgi:hypothetical protein